MFDARELRAVALEQTAGELPPEQALDVAREMIRDRRVLTLEGGRMTTLAVRAQEQAIERRAELLAQPAGRDVGERTRAGATRESPSASAHHSAPSSAARRSIACSCARTASVVIRPPSKVRTRRSRTISARDGERLLGCQLPGGLLQRDGAQIARLEDGVLLGQPRLDAILDRPLDRRAARARRSAARPRRDRTRDAGRSRCHTRCRSARVVSSLARRFSSARLRSSPRSGARP